MNRKNISAALLLSMALVLAALSVVIGLFPGALIDLLTTVGTALM